MKKIIRAFLLAFFGFVSLANAGIDDIKLLTEDYAPFNYKDGSNIKGIAVDILGQMLKKMGSAKTIKDVELIPWANGYKQVQENANTMLFSMTKTQERSDLFKWVGPISSSRAVLFAKKGSGIKVSSYEDVKKYTIGAIRDDVAEQILTNNGIEKETIDRSSTPEAHMKKFKAGRFDLMAASDNFLTGVKNAPLSYDDLEIAFVLNESSMYYAFSKTTDDETVNEYQKAFDEVNAEGKVQAIKDSYLK